MQPFLAVATVVAALAVAVNSETSYALQPIARSPRAGISTGWGWRPVKTFTIALPSLTKGWGSGGGGGGGGGGWGKKPSGISFGVYGGLRIGPKDQGWGWQPQKQQHGWGWQPQKQHGWGWQPQKQQGWGWKQQGWGWGGDDSDEDDYRALSGEEDEEEEEDDLAYDEEDASSEEDPYDDASDESDESAEDDEPLDLRNAISYPPVY